MKGKVTNLIKVHVFQSARIDLAFGPYYTWYQEVHAAINKGALLGTGV